MSPEEHKAKLAKSGVRVVDFAIDRVGEPSSRHWLTRMLTGDTERVDSRSSKDRAQTIDHVEDVMNPEGGSKRSGLLSKVSLSGSSARS